MPTYEYACTSCGNQWEAEQSIKADPLTECPACKESTAKRQISRGTGFILKGGGWYSDLYASAGNKSAADTASSIKATQSESSSSSTPSSDGGSSTSSASTAASTSSGSSSGSSGGGSSSSGSSGSST